MRYWLLAFALAACGDSGSTRGAIAGTGGSGGFARDAASADREMNSGGSGGGAAADASGVDHAAPVDLDASGNGDVSFSDVATVHDGAFAGDGDVSRPRDAGPAGPLTIEALQVI